jgi:uncharacterized protein (DUF58 family)
MAIALKLPDWSKWLRAAQAGHAPAVLSARHIYILPTRSGWFFALLLLLMLAGAINYNLSLGFALIFLLAAIGNMAMLHAWRNLAYLQTGSGRVEPVFAGSDAVFEIVLADCRHLARYAIAANFEPAAAERSAACVDIRPDGQAVIKLHLPATRRGWLKAPRIKLHTEFPLGLFHVWAYVDLNDRCLVYPHPAEKHLPLPAAPDQQAHGHTDSGSGDDDFSGHRVYQAGDSPKRVDWKASSREQGMFTKQFTAAGQGVLWLDWSLTPGNDDEQRIRQLARWAIDADAGQQPYGLRLPGIIYPPDTGKRHLHQCLRALALF